MNITLENIVCEKLMEKNIAKRECIIPFYSLLKPKLMDELNTLKKELAKNDLIHTKEYTFLELDYDAMFGDDALNRLDSSITKTLGCRVWQKMKDDKIIYSYQTHQYFKEFDNIPELVKEIKKSLRNVENEINERKRAEFEREVKNKKMELDLFRERLDNIPHNLSDKSIEFLMQMKKICQE